MIINEAAVLPECGTSRGHHATARQRARRSAGRGASSGGSLVRWQTGGGRRRTHAASEADAVRQRHAALLASARSVRRGHCGWNSKRRTAWRVKSARRACDERARRARGERAASGRASRGQMFEGERDRRVRAVREALAVSDRRERAARSSRRTRAARRIDVEIARARERNAHGVERATRGGARPGFSAENGGSLRVTRSRAMYSCREPPRARH